jgi:cytochrome P450
MSFPEFVSDLAIPPQEYHRQLREWSGWMRKHQPVVYNEATAEWVVFRYADVVRVTSDYAVFSSEGTVIKDASDQKQGTSIIEMDPPQHQRMRSLVTQAFSARTISALAPQIKQITNDLIDRTISKGKMDWMVDFAHPLPVIVIAEMLGLPRDQWPHFKAWTDSIINRSPDSEQAAQSLMGFFIQAVETRRQHPGQKDILSLLIESEVDGQHLSQEDLLSFCSTLLIAGNITTTTMLGNAIMCLDEHPEAIDRLRQHPEAIPTAVEEILRYMPPFRAGPNDLLRGRLVKTDVQLGDQWIRKGEKVQVNRIAANFDERQFPDPNSFDVERTPNRHQSFGHGVHFCLGAPLARLEVAIALETMLERFQSIQLLHDKPLEQMPSLLIFCAKELPMTFQAA